MTITAGLLIGVLSLGQLDPVAHLATVSQGLESPAGLAITSDGTLLVTDPQANAVVRFVLATPGAPFDPVGNPYSYAGTWSEPLGPVGIAVNANGLIFVSRRDDAQVGVYNSSFVFQRLIGDGAIGFVKPMGLAIDDANGRLLIVDSGTDKFYMIASAAFDVGDSPPAMVGMRGGQASQFKHPSPIAYDPVNERIIVGDQDNFRLQLFTGAGLSIRKFGYRIMYLANEPSVGWVERTSGVAFDALGRVYVVDAVMATVRVFTPEGTDLGKVVDYGVGGGGLQNPADVALDADGLVFVANSTGGTVEIYVAVGVGGAARIYYGGSNAGEYDLFAQRYAYGKEATRSGSRTSDSSSKGSSPQGSPKSSLLRDIPGWDPPHMLDDVLCTRCHDVDSQPEGHLGTFAGQANVCISCHTGGGPALAALIRPTANLGMSHAWGVDAVNSLYGSVGPAPGGEMERFLDGGLIKCATCHDQHNNDVDSPFLRVEAALMCQECHVNHSNHTPPDSAWQPDCLDCHTPHDPNNRNLSLIRAVVDSQTLGVDKAVVFTARSGANSFDDGDPAANDGICQVCHTQTDYHTHDGTGTPHNDGATCTGCHPHADGFMPTAGACDACHGAPPATGAHLVHFGVDDLDLVVYGGTDNVSTASAHGFQCGTCHPLSPTSHMNGTVNVELHNASAPAGSLKALNPPTASYTPGGTQFFDVNGLPYTLGSCSDVYCHSKADWFSPDPISLPVGVDGNGNLTYDPYAVTESKVYATVNWGDSVLGCNACHRNMPQTSDPEVQAGVGNSHSWIDGYGYDNYHAWNMGFEPLVCRVCHYATVTENQTWTRDGMGVATYDDVPIADKSYHVNGTKDVVFDPVNPVIYDGWYGQSIYSLALGAYDSQTKLCSNVPCHKEQLTPEWGKPYRWENSTECNQCHQYRRAGRTGPSDVWDSREAPLQTACAASGGRCVECHEGHGLAR